MLSQKVIIIICCALASSCSQEDISNLKSKFNGSSKPEVEEAVPLIELTEPAQGSMDADVAVVVNAAWDTLDNALQGDSLTTAARAEAYADYGLVAFGNGLTLPALSAFDNASRLSPEEPRWSYFLALMQQYSGQLDDAVISFEHVLKLLPNNIPTLLRLADVRYEQAEIELANTLYLQALKKNPNSAAAHYGLGRVSAANDQHNAAINHFEKALELQPQAYRINYFLGMSWRRLGEREKATDLLSRHGSVEPSFPDPLFDQISGGEERIDGLWAHMNAGSQAFVDGDYSKAVNEFKLATKDLPDDHRSWQSLGMALNKAQDNKAAISAYQQALSLSQENAVILHELARLVMSEGDFQQAENYLKEAVKIDPRMLDAHVTLASLKNKLGAAEDALKHYDNALDLDPQSGELAILRAETLLALKRPSDALLSLKQATMVNPSDANVRMSYSLVLADTGEVESAMLEAIRALKDADTDQTQSSAHYTIGMLYLKQSNGDQAISSFASALRINPRHRLAGLELARTFLRVRETDQALGTYEVFLNNWPDEAGARVEAARVAVMRGDGAKAEQLLQAGIKRTSSTPRLIGTMARLLVLSTDADIRNPQAGLALAQQAFNLEPAPQHQETLALCHAALGDYVKAVELQKKLLQQFGDGSNERVKTRMQKNLTRYQSKELGRLPFDAS